MRVYVEDWGAGYGTPYLVDEEDPPAGDAELVEDGDRMLSHGGAPVSGPHPPLAFIDGVRRGDAHLYMLMEGRTVRGLAAAHAVGAALADGQSVPRFVHQRVSRVVIWGGGEHARLPAVAGGWAWEPRSIQGETQPELLAELQSRMRLEEAALAERLSQERLTVVVDGPLHRHLIRDRVIAGYVKTHHRALLAPEHHRAVPELDPGCRTSLFRLGEDRYSCYLRIAARTRLAGPWSGVVRLEVPQSAGRQQAVELCDLLAGIIPRYASLPHRDPRAPQNLQPVGALEKRLRHLLGDPGLARRAVGAAAARLVEEQIDDAP